jgi:peptide/nickel transport system substrate-binding protein
MMKRSTFHLKWIAVSLVTAIFLAQCAGPAPSTPATTGDQPQATPAAESAEGGESGEVSRSDVFVYAHPTTFPELDPAASYSNDLVVMANCYETLTFYNAPGSEEVLSPKLATEWESNEDSTEWTFTLRQGVLFNAEAVKYSIETTKEKGLGAAYIWDPVESIEAVDDYTVKFTLSYPAPLDLIASANYAAWIYSPKAYAANSNEWLNEGHCIGTGPYMIESYERGSRLVMTRFDDYWGGWQDGQFQKMVFELIEDQVVLQQKIESGEADFTYQVPADNIEALQNNPDLTVYTNPSFQNLLGLYNTQKPPLDNKLVRQALSYSFPYDDFMTGVMNSRATQAYGPVPVGMWGSSTDLYQYTYDLDKAAQLLEEAGYKDGGFSLLYTYDTGNLDEQQAGELWKAELAKLGIDLELQGLNWEAQWDLGKADPAQAQDIFVMYWWPDLISPYSFLYSIFHSQDEVLFNLAYYNNPEFDQTIEAANEITGSDREQASQMFIDAQKTLIDDAVSLFFFDENHVHIANSSIKGFVDNPAYPHVVFTYDLTR